MSSSPKPPAIDRERDEAVLRGVLDGAPGAFDAFVARFGNRIYAFGLRMCRHREDAEDVLQETLLTAYRKLRTLRAPGALTTWLYRIVVNACVSLRRKSKQAPERDLPLDQLLPDGEGAAEALTEDSLLDDVHRRQVADALERAARDLPPDYRVVWMLRDVEGLSTAETAEALGIGVSNVKMRLHRARMALRKSLLHLRPEGTE